MEHSEQLGELAKALVAVQKVLRPALKDSQNPHFKSKYADLESVMETIREPLAEHGLAVVQGMEPAQDGVVVVTTLLHESGQWMRGKCLLKPQRNDPQGIGSCITYGRRYGAAAIVGLHQTDDDGEAASGRGEGSSTNKLAGPARLSDRAVRPPDAPPLELTGDEDPLLTKTEQAKLKAIFREYGVQSSELAEYYKKINVANGYELRQSHLAGLVTWAKRKAA